MPPTNFSTSKENGSPNKDAVKRRDDWRITRDTKEARIKLIAAEAILEPLTSGSTPKTTFVIFDPAKGFRDKISTCLESGNKQLDKNIEK